LNFSESSRFNPSLQGGVWRISHDRTWPAKKARETMAQDPAPREKVITLNATYQIDPKRTRPPKVMTKKGDVPSDDKQKRPKK
jgi:hypothetical protein